MSRTIHSKPKSQMRCGGKQHSAPVEKLLAQRFATRQTAIGYRPLRQSIVEWSTCSDRILAARSTREIHSADVHKTAHSKDPRVQIENREKKTHRESERKIAFQNIRPNSDMTRCIFLRSEYGCFSRELLRKTIPHEVFHCVVIARHVDRHVEGGYTNFFPAD